MSSKWILSATEIETFEICRRKWAYTYLDGIKPPPSQAAKLGLSVHKILEKHLTGYVIDYQSTEGQIAKAGLPYLPQKLPEKNVEHTFFFIKDGHIFHGYIDFFEQVGSQTWLIGDHKTCSSFKNALTEEKLRTNTQASIYAQWAFQELGAETVKLKWIYYCTKGTPKAKAVEIEINKHEQPKLFWPQLQIASDIKIIVEEQRNSLEMPKNLNACFKYGRCAFYDSCRANLKPTNYSPAAKRLPMSFVCTESKVVTQKAKESFHLFVDCAPVKTNSSYTQTIELSDFLKPVLKKIHQEKNLSHYRLAGYGQHVGIMAHYLEDYLNSNDFDSRTAILSSSKTPEGIDTLQTLSAAASHVIRGF